MASFTIDMSSPFRSGFTRGLGGPDSGGHKGPNWYIEYGMDLGASAGTEVRAVFDAHITRFTPHVPANDTSHVFGAQLFMRSTNDMMGEFYTHLTDVPAGIRVGSLIRRGDLLRKVHPGRGAPHLHLALVEIIDGVAAQRRYVGVNLYEHFLAIGSSSSVSQATFNQDGTPPTVAD